MAFPVDNSNWSVEYALIDDLPVPPGGELPSFDPPAPIWLAPPFPDSVSVSVPFNVPLENLDCVRESGSRKRARVESSNAAAAPPPRSKACREKMRRDKLNDMFNELHAILEPGRPPKMDKSAILSDAIRMVTQLRDEVEKLKESNASHQEKITELKAEKNELRDEKQRLKMEIERLERQLKTIVTPPPAGYLPHPHPMAAAAFAAAAPGQMGGKLMPFVGYPQVSMWQFMPPAAVDTSQDHSIRPPVA